jgi:hypothetical protein
LGERKRGLQVDIGALTEELEAGRRRVALAEMTTYRPSLRVRGIRRKSESFVGNQKAPRLP